MSEKEIAVQLSVIGFDCTTEADAYSGSLIEAFSAMPESAPYMAVSKVITNTQTENLAEAAKVLLRYENHQILRDALDLYNADPVFHQDVFAALCALLPQQKDQP